MRAFVRIVVGLFMLALLAFLESVPIQGASNTIVNLIWNSGYHYECGLVITLAIFYFLVVAVSVLALGIWVDEEIKDRWRLL